MLAATNGSSTNYPTENHPKSKEIHKVPIYHHQVSYQRLLLEELAKWREISTSIIGDCLNRSGCMSANIKAIVEGQRLFGHARTVQTMVGDNSTLHAGLELCQPGDVLVVDSGGVENIALWGGACGWERKWLKSIGQLS
jgi:4-hydroxy-4-methyl-2-oxoglutarate aldolase